MRVQQLIDRRRESLKHEYLPCTKCGGEIDYDLPTGYPGSFYPWVPITTDGVTNVEVEPRHYECCS